MLRSHGSVVTYMTTLQFDHDWQMREAISDRLVVVPAWGTPSGPWKTIRDAWPGPTETFVGAGLLDRPVPTDWSLEVEISQLATIINESDILCGPGWAASTALLAAGRRRPRVVVLFSPPLGLDFSDAAAQIGSAEDARAVMSRFGGSAEYWAQAEQASNFVTRVRAFLLQNVAASSQSVECPIIVIWSAMGHLDTPEGWTNIACEPIEVPSQILATLNK
jgi:hypothetical protein